MDEYDVIVIGAGHAGCEAGLAAARMGCETLLCCINLESVAMMPCNPSIGGTGKGHLVCEIDALGGEMGVNIDKTFLQSRMLNTSKGPAVHSLRAQADKNRYHLEMKKAIEKEPRLHLKQMEVTDLTVENGRVTGVVTKTFTRYNAKAVIICTGTFLGGKIFIGDSAYSGGPSGLAPSNELAENLYRRGFPMRRFKTGTPARMLGSTLDYSKMKEQPGDEEIIPFSFLNEGKDIGTNRVSCWLSYTNAETHRVILDNIEKSAMYSGHIVGVGPRYCPSIEDKVSRFRDRERHQLFVEPEGLDTDEMYIQGMSSSLPEDVQRAFYHTIPGLEHAEIVRPAYAIEYDCVDPLSLKPGLESKLCENLFCAGQFNGSSGYEEAAAQGLIAGINAALKLRGEEPLVLGREEAYIGVLIDDLVTKGTNEPYRIMTSRAEYRLLLRQENADRRLTETGYRVGLVTEERYQHYLAKQERIDREIGRLQEKRAGIDAQNRLLEEKGSAPAGSNLTFFDLLKRPQLTYEDLAELDDDTRPALNRSERYAVEVRIKYDGYIQKQIAQVAKLRKLESRKIRDDIDYQEISGLRLEARQKLSSIRPRTVGQASRISGVSPADVNVLLVWLEKEAREREREEKDRESFELSDR
ncbi:MAG: tRNA uridine-5-carboxymethylaminomethyl(34) synthesis enzyme MnmG [Mogibacterium sp.]|nr:tRNA uridine-5-carboxymethylaminomethyl(34) synthesis enzyme MnmG [Mogibacterium sp.]